MNMSGTVLKKHLIILQFILSSIILRSLVIVIAQWQYIKVLNHRNDLLLP